MNRIFTRTQDVLGCQSEMKDVDWELSVAPPSLCNLRQVTFPSWASEFRGRRCDFIVLEENVICAKWCFIFKVVATSHLFGIQRATWERNVSYRK